MAYLLGVDFGTGGSKACLTDIDMNQLAYSYQEYPILTEKLDYSEHDPVLYWKSFCKNVHACIKNAGIDAREIVCIALSSAMPSMVVTDKDGNSLGRAINMLDHRAKKEASSIIAQYGMDGYFEITANRLEDHPSIVNLLWIKNNEPERYRKIAHVHSIDSYISYLLTGVHNINSSNAMFFGGYSIPEKKFNNKFLEDIGLNPNIFPQVTDCTTIIGTVSQHVAEETGLAPGTKVLSGQTDCNASWLGAGATKSGDIQMNLGTCGNMGIIMDSPNFSPLMINWPYTIPQTYVSVPTTQTGGVLMRYVRDNFSPLERATESITGVDAYDLLNREAETVRPGSEGLVVLPYLMGERTPIWDNYAKGTVFGLSLRHNKRHLVRAMMESVAYALYHNFEILLKHVEKINCPIVLNEGGAKSMLWRKIITDVFNVPTVLVKHRTGAPYGDCLLAGVGCGLIDSFDSVHSKVEYIHLMEPDAHHHEIYMDYYAIYKNLYLCLKDQFVELDKVNRRHLE